MSRRGKKNATPEQEKIYLQLVSFGLYPAQAARKIGFTPHAFINRKRRDLEFRERFYQAESSAEMGLLAHVIKAAAKEWRAALALLERRFPERWARPEVRAIAAREQAAASARDRDVWVAMIAQIPGRKIPVAPLPAAVADAPPPESTDVSASPEDEQP